MLSTLKSSLRSKVSRVGRATPPSTQGKRSISFVAADTKTAKGKIQAPGHIWSEFSEKERSYPGTSQYLGFGGHPPSISKNLPKKTVYRLDESFDVGPVHNLGKRDSTKTDIGYTETRRVTLPDLTHHGVTAAMAFDDAFGKSGTTYMTTDVESELNGKRTRNCVGFQRDLVRALSGVDLPLETNAFVQDGIEAINNHRLPILKGAEARGYIAATHIPWVYTEAEQKIANATSKAFGPL